jgi:hypothetical protein
LPVFESIRTTRLGEVHESAFEDTFPSSRVKSFMHYWLLLVDGMGKSAASFQELLASDGVALRFSAAGGPITTFEQLERWLTGAFAQVAKSAHQPENLKIEIAGDGVYAVSVDFGWSGVSKTGRLMAARDHHDWILQETGERFLRIKEAKATTLEPVHGVE